MENGCDVLKVRSVAMKKVWEKSHILMKEGIPLTKEIFGSLIKQEMAAAKESCQPVSIDLSRAQKRLIKEVCPICRLDSESEKE